MTKKQKKMLLRIIIAAVMLAALYFLPVTGWLRLGLYLVPLPRWRTAPGWYLSTFTEIKLITSKC